MLTLAVPGSEMYDEARREFLQTEPTVLRLEHSLKSVAVWESKWKKPFLSSEKSAEECRDYVRCMTLGQEASPLVYQCLTPENYAQVNAYLEDPMTATTIRERGGAGRNREVITSEVIYCWMVQLGIPFSCEGWHLNRLLTLIRVCSLKNAPQQKMSRKDIYQQNRMLNAERKRRMGSRG